MVYEKEIIYFSVVVLMTAFMVQNSAYANLIENNINQNVLYGQSPEESMTAVMQSAQFYSMQHANNMDIFAYTTMPKQQRQMAKLKNRYALAEKDMALDQTINVTDDTNFWIKPYASFEKVRSLDGFKTKNNSYGVYMGANTGLKELSNGWDYIWGGYVGYNGAYNSMAHLSMYQNGGTFGFENMFIKDNFFTGFDISFGAASASVKSFNMNATYINGGITNRTGYNFEFADGKFIIQPNLYTSYMFSQTFGDTVHNGIETVAIESNVINAVQLAPGINFIGNLGNGWQPYAGVTFIVNFLPSGHFVPWYATMPDLSTRPIIKYGVGVRKTLSDRCSAMFQAFVRNGGRNGVGLQGAFNFAIGK